MKTLNQILLSILIILVIIFGLIAIFNPEKVRDWNDRFNGKTPCDMIQEKKELTDIENSLEQSKIVRMNNERFGN